MAESLEARIANLERKVNGVLTALSVLVGSIAIVEEGSRPVIIPLLNDMLDRAVKSSIGEKRIVAELARDAANAALSDLRLSSRGRGRKKKTL